jgi:D-alanyl-D-alanine carboxypeptidase
MQSDNYLQRVHHELARLGIPMSWIVENNLPFHAEAAELAIGDRDDRGRTFMMTPATAVAWQHMRDAATKDDVVLEVVSSFRTLERQIEIIQAKLDRSMPMSTILTLSAPPGYSEHHTGRAIDINTPGCIATETAFEDTDAFRWLQTHAGNFGFTLSYPRGNKFGFIYEPWHWCFQPEA